MNLSTATTATDEEIKDIMDYNSAITHNGKY